jgi:uncharacterized damage-inducible protein DinB
MNLIPLFQKEMGREAVTTLKMLSLIPDDRLEWRPHPRSMSLKQLGTHLAELPSWVSMALNTTELDFAKMDYKPTPVASTREIIETFEKSLLAGQSSLQNASEEDLLPEWTFRSGNMIFLVEPRHEVIRLAFCQTVHHRAQLGVFLRLLDIPIPGSYGPSADEDQTGH